MSTQTADDHLEGIVGLLQETLLALEARLAGGGVSPTPILTNNIVTAARIGDDVTLTWSGVTTAAVNDRMVLVKSTLPNGNYVSAVYMSGTQTPPVSPLASGSLHFTIPGGLLPDTYEFRILAAGGTSVSYAKTTFTLEAVVVVTLATLPTSVPAVGGAVTVSWAGIRYPVNTDWIALVRKTALTSTFEDYRYLNGTQSAPVSGSAAGSFSWTVPQVVHPGEDYEFRLLRSYPTTGSSLATATLAIDAALEVETVIDTFTGISGTALSAHAGELGAEWTRYTGYTGVLSLSDDNRLRISTTVGAAPYYASGVPLTPDYSVTAEWKVFSVISGHDYYVLGRASTDVRTAYFAAYSSALSRYMLGYYLNGSPVVVDFVAHTLAPGDAPIITLGMAGDQITMVVNGVVVLTITSTVITQSGRAGISIYADDAAAAETNSTGIHFTDFRVNNAQSGVLIEVGDTWQTVIDASPAGTQFIIEAGVHRLQTIAPRDGDSYIGQDGAIMKGSKILASGSFVTASGFWKITGQTQEGEEVGQCQVGHSRCGRPEELFRDGVRMETVASTGELATGKWFFDYSANEIYVGDNPAGHVIETSVTTYAFQPTGDNVTIRNLLIEQYAVKAQYGAVNGEGTSGWSVTDNIIRLNHGGAIRIGDGMQVLRNLCTLNGEIGIVGVGDNVLVDNNEISYNNMAFFDHGWEGGGTKFVLTNGLVVSNNFVHHNEGPGLWLDIDNRDFLVTDNISEDNHAPTPTAGAMGILIEISRDGIVQNNRVNRNGAGFPNYGWGAGICIAASPGVEVTGNILVDNQDGIIAIQQDRGSGAYGPHEIEDLNVHHNTVTHPYDADSAWAAGFLHSAGDDPTYYTTRNNHFENNTYHLQTSYVQFTWNNDGYVTFAAWQGYGNDDTGSASLNTVPTGIVLSSFTQVGSDAIQTAAPSVAASGRSFYVATTGSDAAAGTLAAPFRSFSKGISVLTPGDNLLVRAGTYDEIISSVPSGTSWSNKVRIAAYPGETVWLSPTNPGQSVIVLYHGAEHYVEFDGINIDGTHTTNSSVQFIASGDGVNGQVHHVRLQNCEVRGSGGQNITTASYNAGEIGGFEFLNLSVHGGSTTYFEHNFYIKSDNNLIENCDIYDFAGGGIHFFTVDYYPMVGNVARNNRIHDNHPNAGNPSWGIIDANGSSGTLIYNNTVYSMTANGSGDTYGIYGFAGIDARIYNNTIRGGGDYGIGVASGVSGTAIDRNVSYGNAAGNYQDLGDSTTGSGNQFGVGSFNAFWYVTGQTVDSGSQDETLYFGDVLKTKVGTLASVGPGKWFFDYAADRIYVGDDPTGVLVQLLV